MPKVTVWIRVDDVDTWQSIKDRADWIHDKLQEEKEKQERQSDRQTSMDAPHLRPKPNPRPLDNVMEMLDRPLTGQKDLREVPRPPDPETGYPCCELAKPCKHWVFNGDIQAWVNSLTGKTKEVA